MPESVWLRCEGCGRQFRAPRWRSHCYYCGGDDEPPLGRLLLAVAVIDLAMLLVWRFLT